MLAFSTVVRRACLVFSTVLFVAFAAGEGRATTLELSTLASESQLDYLGTPLVELLDATVDFDIVGIGDPACNNADCLKITLTNDTDTNVPTFLADISTLAWSGSGNVTSIAADTLPAGWSFVLSTGNGGPTDLNGFGIHDYAVSSNPSNSLGPGSTFVFTFAVNGGLTMNDFIVNSQPKDGSSMLSTAVAKFIRFRDGPDTELNLIDLCDDGDPQTPACDSSFGAVPEPATAVLFGLGLVGLGIAGRRARS